jgi:hypothetical protein
MLSETGPIIFYDHKFDGASLPEGDDVSEATRLRAAAVGVYELTLRQQPHYEFSGAFLFNDEKAQRQQKQFEVSEDITKDERSLTIQSAADVIDLDSLEFIPLDWRGDPLEFTPLETSKSQRKISYRKDAPVESVKLKLSGINVFEVETINATLWTTTENYSPEKLSTFIRRSEDIRLDQLDNSAGGARTVEDHFHTFFRLLLEKTPNRSFDFECGYRSKLGDGVPDALVPVMFQQSLTLPAASELFSLLQSELRRWYQSVSPADGVFNFGVKVYGAAGPVPVIYFTSLVLPVTSIAGWPDAGAN